MPQLLVFDLVDTKGIMTRRSSSRGMPGPLSRTDRLTQARLDSTLTEITLSSRPESCRAGLSYTVASIGFVGTKPAAKAERGSAPVTPNTIQ